MEKPSPESAIFSVDQAVNASREEIIGNWKSYFPQYFPGFVKTMLSPQGLTDYSEEDRKKLFASSLEAFNTLPWSRFKGPYYSERTANYIDTFNMWFNEKGEIIRHKGMGDKPFAIQTDYLFYTDIACLLLLGMSLNSEEATTSILNLFNNVDKNKRNTLIKALNTVLPEKSSTGKWIKDNRLDASIEGGWDSRIAELLFNLPEFRIDAQKGTPKKLPSFMTKDAPKLYSEEVFDVFLEYALQYAQSLIKWMDAKRERDLVDFMLMVRRDLPKEYVEKPSTKSCLQTINKILDERKNLQQEERQGKLLHVRDVLPHVPPDTQWFRVKGIMQ